MYNLFDKLRVDTSALHREIESTNPLMDPRFSRCHYVNYLQRLLLFYSRIEPRLAQLLNNVKSALQLERRTKANLILKDLEALDSDDVDATWFEHAISHTSEYLEAIVTTPQAMGAIYVLEGSTLGGVRIAKHLQKHLGLHPSELHFFNAYGNDTQAMWNFLKVGAQQMHLEGDYPTVLGSAKLTFRHYGSLISREHFGLRSSNSVPIEHHHSFVK